MFIDFLPLMLVNMSAGLFLLACYGFGDFDRSNRPQWAPAFIIVGLVATICGFYLIFKFPLIGPYNIAFGETSILLGMLFLAGAWTVSKGWSLSPLAVYALFAGAAAILMGAAFIAMQLSKAPLLTGIGFILTGSAGVLMGPILWVSAFRPLRWIAGIALIIASGIWALVAGGAYWNHLTHFKEWMPLIYENITK
jgi:putative membrane protein